MTTAKWTDERTSELTALIGGERPISADSVQAIAEKLDVSTRSVSAKLRKLGYEVASMAKGKAPSAFSQQETENLASFVKRNAGKYTYSEVAENFAGGKFTAKQIQGKILSLELTANIRATEKVAAPHKYTEAEESTFVKMANAGAFIEDIAEQLGKQPNSIRGKALSLLRSGNIEKIPAQRESTAKNKEDALDALGDISAMTVAEIAETLNKTERGIRTTLTRRGLSCADYDGVAKREKADAAKTGE